MAVAGGMPAPARNPSPAGLNLSSNNPFRNRTSPLPSPSTLTPPAVNPTANNRMSRNPFLDSNAVFPSGTAASTRDTDAVNGITADIFSDLSVLDKPAKKDPPPVGSRPPRSGTLPVQPPSRPDRQSPARRDLKPSHQRRNSESSVIDKDRQARRDRERGERPPRTESEERRRRERRKEREERYRREGRSKSGRPQRGLDLIDKLDVTGVYGQGVFHHDGPFDACNPHRNVKRDRRAPMQAFPADSMNMALGGSGPLRNRIDLDRFHGRGEEGFSDFANARKTEMTVHNPTDKIEQVHGQETFGLGTSTFLEGAPAPKNALPRRESDERTAQESSIGGGLQRKKSLAQRLRGMSNTRRERPGELRQNLIPAYNREQFESGSAIDDSPPRIKASSAGGIARVNAGYTRETEVNSFENEYDAAFDRKGAQIRVLADSHPPPPPYTQSPEQAQGSQSAESSNAGRARAPSNPKNLTPRDPLTRSKTEDSTSGQSQQLRAGVDEEKPAGGFLNRMKSLRGGRRARPERRGSEY